METGLSAYIAAYEQTRQQINMLEEQAHRVVTFFPLGLAGLAAYGYEKSWPDPILYGALALMLFSCLYVLQKKEGIFRLAGYLAECVEPSLPPGVRYERMLDSYRKERDAATTWRRLLSATGLEVILMMGITLALFVFGYFQQHGELYYLPLPLSLAIVSLAVCFGFVFVRGRSIQRLRRRDAPHRIAWRLAVTEETVDLPDGSGE